MVESEETKDQTLKVVIAGDQGVGKTSLIKRFVDNPESQN
jgi:GTPase SAR1 family protein